MGPPHCLNDAGNFPISRGTFDISISFTFSSQNWENADWDANGLPLFFQNSRQLKVSRARSPTVQPVPLLLFTWPLQPPPMLWVRRSRVLRGPCYSNSAPTRTPYTEANSATLPVLVFSREEFKTETRVTEKHEVS